MVAGDGLSAGRGRTWRGGGAGRRARHPARGTLGTRRALGYAALARGAAARGTARTGALREAVALLADSPARSGHARGLLLLGRALVEDGAVREGREHLREAVGLARRCGCVALARRARDELIAAGGRMREVTASPLDMLTGTERTVAGLVASAPATAKWRNPSSSPCGPWNSTSPASTGNWESPAGPI
ncbi:hypothetical protein ACW23B_01020 [Streptomyces albidoflavus]